MGSRGRREFIALCCLTALTQVMTGVVAVLQGAPQTPWGSLLWRPLLILPFFILVPLLGRRASFLFSAWLGYLALAYVFGVVAARSPALKLMRGISLLVMASSAIWLQLSPHIRAYLRDRPRRVGPAAEPGGAADVRPK